MREPLPGWMVQRWVLQTGISMLRTMGMTISIVCGSGLTMIGTMCAVRRRELLFVRNAFEICSKSSFIFVRLTLEICSKPHLSETHLRFVQKHFVFVFDLRNHENIYICQKRI